MMRLLSSQIAEIGIDKKKTKTGLVISKIKYNIELNWRTSLSKVKYKNNKNFRLTSNESWIFHGLNKNV